ncbi:rifin [Plasmodium reichenowi]|uniref:Rifin n=1 Tax=Plasmodium reichenowi TaxID=5854 RepID=A0A060RQE6_PLARE|nr:rifin [Plasmodium reichenowi]
MKVHYINILLVSLPLNILLLSSKINVQRNHNITTYHTQKIPTTRLLCECDLYMPSYDNYPQMKEIMENFNKQTQQRFQEYDDRMVEKRKQCKDRCDKDIQKIILKDKLEKELTETFSTLHTDIQSDAIPTCVCEKSMTDKVEKTCLRCGGVFGGGVAPSVGLLGGIGEAAMSVWKVAALKTAAKYAMSEGLAFGKVAGDIQGKKVVIFSLEQLGIKELYPDLLKLIGTKIPYYDVTEIAGAIITKKGQLCSAGTLSSANGPMCSNFNVRFGLYSAKGSPIAPPDDIYIPQKVGEVVGKAIKSAKAVAKNTTKGVNDIITRQQTSEIAATYGSWQTAITTSIIAIVVIVLIMIIFYLVLRYRRKKKMKKKLQYIKLLEE